MGEIVINIENTGKTSGLHFDNFPMSFLGKMQIGRASEIFFDEDNQNWQVILPGDDHAVTPAKGFDSYDEARQFEVNWLQGCMKADVHPTSNAGLRIAAGLRVKNLEENE